MTEREGLAVSAVNKSNAVVLQTQSEVLGEFGQDVVHYALRHVDGRGRDGLCFADERRGKLGGSCFETTGSDLSFAEGRCSSPLSTGQEPTSPAEKECSGLV